MNLKTFHLLLIFVLVSITSNSQSKKQFAKAKVSYTISIKPDKNQGVYKIHEKYSPGLTERVEKVSSELEFSLVFNDTISLFYLEKKLFSDDRAAFSAISHSGYYGRINQQSKAFVTEELQEDFGKFLVIRSYQKWKLDDETKIIGDFVCFKATTFFTTTNPKGKVFTHDFTAWYTPQLPYKFGPVGYGNLPGLIIELQGKDFTYGVKKITFYDNSKMDKENEIPKLKNLKSITEEEFEKLAADDEKRWRKQD